MFKDFQDIMDETKLLEKNLIDFTIIVVSIVSSVFLLVVFSVIFNRKRDKKLLKSVTKSYRGTGAERDLVLKLLKRGIPEQAIFHDLYVRKPDGKYSQIDLVVAARVGIIVFEIKDYSGWLFGNGRNTHWTQVLAYGKEKHRFYNPIIQNNKHIIDLRKQLIQFEKIPFYSVVVFYGDCVLKDISFVPEGTFIVKSERVMEVVNIILNKNEVAPYTNKHEVVKVLKEAVQNGEKSETQIQHIKNIKNMLGKHRVFD